MATVRKISWTQVETGSRPSPGNIRACVGMRGSRVQAVVNELQGEKIDIIPWSPDIATFVVNALAPAEVAKVVLDEDSDKIEVVVPDEQLSLAIGRRGQNVRLASQLTGWDIDILTEQEESERRKQEFEHRSTLFINALNVDETVGQLLASEASARSRSSPMSINPRLPRSRGFDEETAQELQNRARNYLAMIEAEHDAKRKELGVEDALLTIDGVTMAMLVKFGENDIKTVEDLAGCATDDLTGWTERKDGQTTRHPGALDGFDVSREEGRGDDHGGRVWRSAGSSRRRRPTRAARLRWRLARRIECRRLDNERWTDADMARHALDRESRGCGAPAAAVDDARADGPPRREAGSAGSRKSAACIVTRAVQVAGRTGPLRPVARRRRHPRISGAPCRAAASG